MSLIPAPSSTAFPQGTYQQLRPSGNSGIYLDAWQLLLHDTHHPSYSHARPVHVHVPSFAGLAKYWWIPPKYDPQRPDDRVICAGVKGLDISASTAYNSLEERNLTANSTNNAQCRLCAACAEPITHRLCVRDERKRGTRKRARARKSQCL